MRKPHGFTLIELLVVMAMVAILAAVFVPKFLGNRNQQYCNRAEADAETIRAALAAYLLQNELPEVDTAARDLALINNLVADQNIDLINDASGIDFSGTDADTLTITVADSSGNCNQGGSYTVSMNGAEGTWAP